MTNLILASGSPRRRELLLRMGVNFEVIPAKINEDVLEGESPADLVSRLATEKAKVVSLDYPDSYVLAADTVVVLPNANYKVNSLDQLKGKILGKPDGIRGASKMIARLSGRSHYVMTGYTLTNYSSSLVKSAVSVTEVCFEELTEQMIECYAKSCEGLDKAGAYGIQGMGASLVASIKGSYTNVIGIPLAEVLSLLEGFNLWSPSSFPIVDSA